MGRGVEVCGQFVAVDEELLSCPQKTSDAGLERVARLTKLRAFNLQGTQISDDGLIHLVGLTQLRYLLLGGTKVTDAGLKHLTRHSLTTLDLGSTGVTDAGLKHIAYLSELKDLGLRAAPGVTDVGLIHLAGLKKLTQLNLIDTHVTAEGVRAIKAALPGVRVYSNFE